MAVTKHAVNTSVTIAVESGATADGSAIYSNRTIGRINPAITDEVAYTFAAQVGTLQSFPVGEIFRTDKASISRS